jgi:hypothetical protein
MDALLGRRCLAPEFPKKNLPSGPCSVAQSAEMDATGRLIVPSNRQARLLPDWTFQQTRAGSTRGSSQNHPMFVAAMIRESLPRRFSDTLCAAGPR